MKKIALMTAGVALMLGMTACGDSGPEEGSKAWNKNDCVEKGGKFKDNESGKADFCVAKDNPDENLVMYITGTE